MSCTEYKLNTPNSNIYELARYNISNKHSYEDYLAVIDQAIAQGSWLIWEDYLAVIDQAIAQGSWLIWAVHTGYDLGWEQQQNLDRLLGVLCERGIAVTTASGGLLRLK